MLNLEDTVDLFQRQTSCFDVKEPDDREPRKVEDGEDDIETPADVVDTWNTLSARCRCQVLT